MNIVGIANEFRVATNSSERLGQVPREPNENLKRAHATRHLNSVMVRNQKKDAYRALGSSTSDRVQITMSLWHTATACDPEIAGKKGAGDNIKVRDASHI